MQGFIPDAVEPNTLYFRLTLLNNCVLLHVNAEKDVNVILMGYSERDAKWQHNHWYDLHAGEPMEVVKLAAMDSSEFMALTWPEIQSLFREGMAAWQMQS